MARVTVSRENCGIFCVASAALLVWAAPAAAVWAAFLFGCVGHVSLLPSLQPGTLGHHTFLCGWGGLVFLEIRQSGIGKAWSYRSMAGDTVAGRNWVTFASQPWAALWASRCSGCVGHDSPLSSRRPRARGHITFLCGLAWVGCPGNKVIESLAGVGATFPWEVPRIRRKLPAV